VLAIKNVKLIRDEYEKKIDENHKEMEKIRKK